MFPEPAAAWLALQGGEVRVGVRVKQILAIDSKYRVFFESGVQDFDGVIFAVGPHQLEGLMPDIDPPHLTYEPIVTVYFKFDRRVRMRETMAGQIRGCAQWFFDRQALKENGNALPDANGGLIAAVISASGPHEFLSQEALAERVLAELTQHIPDLPAPVWHKVVTEKFATFACTPQAVRPVTATCYPAVFLAGDYVASDYPATLESAVRNGVVAAEASLAHFQSAECIE